MVLQANPHYYLGQPQFKTITINAVPAIADRVAALESGQADLMYRIIPAFLHSVTSSSSAQCYRV